MNSGYEKGNTVTEIRKHRRKIPLESKQHVFEPVMFKKMAGYPNGNIQRTTIDS